MKSKLTLIILMIFTASTALFAQEVITPEQLIEQGSQGFSSFFVTLAALIPLVTFLSAWVTQHVLGHEAKGWMKQIASWLVALILSMAGWWLKLGVFDGLIWWHALVFGAGVGLAANGFFDIKLIQTMLGVIGIGKKKF